MLISPAYAQGGGGGGGFSLVGLLPLVLIFVVFYFLLIRPQQTKARVHREMVGGVRRGDSVVTGGGVRGKVTKVIDEDWLQVEIADGVRVVVAKGTISNVVTRGQPVKEREAPTRRSGKRRPSARQPEPEPEPEREPEEEELDDEALEDEELEDEEDASFDDDADEGIDDEEPDEEEKEPRTTKKGGKKAAS